MWVANHDEDPINQNCLNDHANEKWKCLMPEYLLEYVKVPVFFVQSEYDGYSLN